MQKSWHNITTRCHILQYILLASIEFDGQKGSGKSQILIHEAISLIFRVKAVSGKKSPIPKPLNPQFWGL